MASNTVRARRGGLDRACHLSVLLLLSGAAVALVPPERPPVAILGPGGGRAATRHRDRGVARRAVPARRGPIFLGRGGHRTAVASPSSLASFFGSWFQSGGQDDRPDDSPAAGAGETKARGGGASQPQHKQPQPQLGGVVGVMEQMDNLKASQRLGGATAALLQELSSLSVEGQSADGRVKVWLDGQQRPLRVELDESCLSGSESPYEVASACLEAMQQAHARSVEKMDDKLKNFYKDLGLS